jgi:hypothetical protein
MGTIVILDQSTTLVNLIDLIDEVFTGIGSTTMEFPTLQLHLLSNLKVVRGKQQDLLARGIVRIEHHDFTLLFLATIDDNSSTYRCIWVNHIMKSCDKLIIRMCYFCVLGRSSNFHCLQKFSHNFCILYPLKSPSLPFFVHIRFHKIRNLRCLGLCCECFGC